ncbi:MAG: isoprenylcysteine carboxylmethyltransferase family protein [Armatimonadota bacterium]|nr:MAG: isoprenylcysteine carboxylmethyltransferase family protein [Armatimonadota bacterium]
MNDSTPSRERLVRWPHKPLRGLLKSFSIPALLVVAFLLSAPSMPWLAIGLVFVILGEGARIWSAGHLVRNERLATGGPYAYTRNPMYLGRMLLIIGISGLVGGIVGIALLIVGLGYFLFAYMPRKETKEPERLAEAFGEEYWEYNRSVPPLLPRLTPYPKATGRWSWRVFLGNREQLTVIFVTAYVVAVVVKWWLGLAT